MLGKKNLFTYFSAFLTRTFRGYFLWNDTIYFSIVYDICKKRCFFTG
jgi:hypothetical protein